jgi:prepilin-type N-terminal cleavage/methylation domain-containing protein
MKPKRAGFTLIELLIILVILAILATMGFNRFWIARDRAFYAAMKSDLRNMASEQEHYFHTHYAYAATPTDLVDLSPSEGVTVTVTYALSDGWAANATHTSLPGVQCGIYTGNAPLASGAPATVNGVIECN